LPAISSWYQLNITLSDLSLFLSVSRDQFVVNFIRIVTWTKECPQVDLLTAWNRVHLEKLTVFRPVKELHPFYGTQSFIIAFKSTRYLSLSWASSRHFMTPHSTYWIRILILQSHLRQGHPSVLLTSRFPTKTSYKSYHSTIRVSCPSIRIRLNLITGRIFKDGTGH
jgi:hypothetical protein